MEGGSVLVTGASRGIGAAIARYLSRRGYRVYGTSRHPELSGNLAEQVEFVRLDLNDLRSIDSCIQRVGELDILINNAGQSQFGPAEEYPLDRTESLFQTNFFGPIRLIQGFLPGMRKRRHGFILNIGSMAGKFAVPFQSGYVASKFALAGYTWALRSEVVPYGIKVVVLEPNDIRTDIEPDLVMSEQSDYRQSVRKFQAVRDAKMASAPQPEIVAKKVARILKTKSPKPFYTVGGLGPLMVFVKRFLPDRMVESLVRRSYGLN